MSKRVVVSVACWSVLAAGCLGGDAGDDAPVRIIPSDEEDMPAGGVDLGGLGGEMGGMMLGGMMGEEVDPLFLRWIRGRVALAEYDCTCSQGDAWQPVWDQQTCVRGWERYIGGEQTLLCQYDALFKDSFNKVRFENYVNCFEYNDAKFYTCIDAKQCTNDGEVVYTCLNEWNRGRNVCIFDNIDVHTMMEGCRAPSDGLDANILTSVYWDTAFSSSPKIVSPIGLDWPYFDRFDDKCNSANICTVMQIHFRKNGLYSSHIMEGQLGNINANISNYNESGAWGLEGGRLFVSPDCERAALMRSGDMIFQRIFFGNIALEGSRTLHYNADILGEDINREYACQDEAGR